MPSFRRALDETDLALITLLRANAREPAASLARKLGLSRTTLQDRLRRLEDTGAIGGYTVRTPDSLSTSQVHALVLISVDSKNNDRAIVILGKTGFVRKLYTISGSYDLCALIWAESTAVLDSYIDEIRGLPGVKETLSSIVLATKIDR